MINYATPILCQYHVAVIKNEKESVCTDIQVFLWKKIRQAAY